MKKVHDPNLAAHLEQIPNIGKAVAKDLKLIEIKKPKDLRNKNPYALYVKLCKKTNSYQDPCMLDTFIAAVHFMNGLGDLHWWEFTEERKENFYRVEKIVKKCNQSSQL